MFIFTNIKYKIVFMIGSSPEDNPIPVYNSASVSKSVSNGELLQIGMKILEEYPFEEMLWRPKITFTNCFYYYHIATILYQVLPAIFFDALLDLIGKPHKYGSICFILDFECDEECIGFNMMCFFLFHETIRQLLQNCNDYQ